jgi:hypothetical protein
MKKIFTLLVLGIILSTQIAEAQGRVNYDRKWFLGLNLGGTYHSNTEVDVNKMYRGGTGFTLGRSFNYNKGNFLSFDLRARYLIAAYRGLATQNFMLDSSNYNILGLGNELQQYQTDYGFYKPNFHSWVNDWSLELQINTNLLREKTGWNLFVFGGIGTVRYHTTIDLYDNDVTFQIKPQDKLDEKGVHYLDYETNVINKRTWMPSFGAGISKQITPNIAFEIMGRMTWTRNNDFDAMPYNLDGTISNINDRYHYASAGFKFRLGWGEGDVSVNSNSHHDNTSNNINNSSTPCISPTISAISPTNNVTVTNNNILVKASIKGKSNGTTIKLYQNNVLKGNMNYDRRNNDASRNIVLTEGINTVKIVVKNSCGTDEKSINIIYINNNTPCNPPSIGNISPVNNTTALNKTIKVSALINGFTDGTSINLYKNNILQGNMSYNTSTHKASKTIDLAVGENALKIVVSNACGTNEKTINITYNRNELPCTPPSITSVSPINNTTVTNSNIQVSAVINGFTNGTSIKLYKNNILQGNMSYNTSTHKASKTISLSEGNNSIKIIVSNDCGTNEKTVVVNYTKEEPCVTPTIGYVSPQPNATLTNANVTIDAQINNFISGTSIKLYKNNVFVGNMIYNAATSVASKSVVLSNGNNNFKIIVSNACGNNQSSFTLIHKSETPCTPPTIGITSPLNNTTLTTSSINVDAIINNYVLGTTIQLYQNNTLVGNMDYNNVTHKASKAITLVQGNNSFKVRVTNSCGNDEKTFVVIYKGSNSIPCNEPTATAYNPQNTNITQSDANITLKIKTTNITSNTQIEVTNNNAIIPFNFNVATQMITININNLNYGLNTIKTTVTNNCGNYKMIYNVTRERCKLPVIGFNSNGTTTNSTYIFNATISNLNDANLITLTLNGTPHNFNFNENTGELLSTLTLQPGNNTISVSVNKCKEIIKNLNVIYTSPCNAPTINISTANTSISPTYVFKANITNIDDANNLTVKHNGNVVNSTFTSGNGQLKAYLTLVEGQNTIQVIANGCETVTKDFVVTYEKPCVTPTITVTSDMTSTSSTYSLTVTITGDVTQADINVVSNGGMTQFGWVDFNKNLHQLTATINLTEGENTITITVNGCETVTESIVINYKSPGGHDTPGSEGPNSESNETAEDTTTVNNSPEDNATGNSNNTGNSNSNGGENTNEVEGDNNENNNTNNNDNPSENPNESCGPRFNPGNSDWEFCLTTPSGVYTRDDLANNPNFTYSGAATSLFFKPIAGGGNATVNGNSYTIQNGKYYLFTGNLTVDVSSSHPGSMGHWEVCLTASTSPTFGNGNNRPTSPCENNDDGNKNENTNQPEIIKISPSKNTAIVNSSTYLFKAKVNNINSKNEVTIFVNGIKQTNFIYSKSSNQVSLVARLKKGQNTIRIEASNNNGKDVEDYIITYQNSNTGTKPSTGSGTKPKTGTTTKPKTGTTTKPKTGSTGTKTIGGKSTGTSKTKTSGTKSSGSTTIKPKTGTTTTKTGTSGTKNTGTTINKGGK